MKKDGPVLRRLSSSREELLGANALDHKIIYINCPKCGDKFWFWKKSIAGEVEIEDQRIGFTNHLSETCPNHTDEVRWDDIK